MSSRRQQQRKVQKKGFVDYKMCAGDSPRIRNVSEEDEKPQEENNNEIDGLSKELQMGCIVDAVKRPPNICVETCVYDEADETECTCNEEGTEAAGDDDDDVAYSDDDFEEDFEDTEDSAKDPKSTVSETDNRADQPECSVKLSKSNSFMSIKGGRANGSVSGKSVNSSKYGSLSIPRTQRVNMSFTNDRLREIERHNHILLNKILYARNVSKSSIPPLAPPAPPRRPPAAAVHRNKLQRQIDHDNMILLRKIQRAKSSSCSLRR